WWTGVRGRASIQDEERRGERQAKARIDGDGAEHLRSPARGNVPRRRRPAPRRGRTPRGALIGQNSIWLRADRRPVARLAGGLVLPDGVTNAPSLFLVRWRTRAGLRLHAGVRDACRFEAQIEVPAARAVGQHVHVAVGIGLTVPRASSE